MVFLKSFFNLFKKLWKLLRPLIAIALICLAVYFALGFTILWTSVGVTAFGATATIGGVGWAVAAAGAAFLVDANTSTEVVKQAAEAVSNAASAIASGVASVAGSALGGLLSSPLGLLVIGGGAYFLLRREKNNKDSSPSPETTDRLNGGEGAAWA